MDCARVSDTLVSRDLLFKKYNGYILFESHSLWKIKIKFPSTLLPFAFKLK